MELKDRLIKIISLEGLTSASFADQIGVQRSSISHIISGRNNPSMDFLQKILNGFPKYNAEWLLMGTGEAYKQSTQHKQPNLFQEVSISGESANNVNNIPDTEIGNTPLNTTTNPPFVPHENNNETEVNDENINLHLETNSKVLNRPESKIERIVIFYTNKTFVEYTP